MFTPDGELREEFKHLEDAGADGERSTEQTPAAPPAHDAVPQAAPPERSAPPMRDPEPEPPPGDGEMASAGFQDLVRLLAEHASVYLSEARRGGPAEAAQHLELARLHVDMLKVLQDKTRGNLNADEQRMLDDVLYQLRAAFVGMRG